MNDTRFNAWVQTLHDFHTMKHVCELADECEKRLMESDDESKEWMKKFLEQSKQKLHQKVEMLEKRLKCEEVESSNSEIQTDKK